MATDYLKTEKAQAYITDIFKRKACKNLNLHLVSAPLFCEFDSGLQVHLPASTSITFHGDAPAYEMLLSLAKWKRVRLKEIGIVENEGIYTHFKSFEHLSASEITEQHLIEWEIRINSNNKNIGLIQSKVERIYDALLQTYLEVVQIFPHTQLILPERIRYVHVSELAKLYPNLSHTEREQKIGYEYRAICILGRGSFINTKEKHGYCPSDVADFTTPTSFGDGLNADILVWNPHIQKTENLATLGIRVDKKVMIKQMILQSEEDWINKPFHQMIMHDMLPDSIGGAISERKIAQLFYPKDIEKKPF